MIFYSLISVIFDGGYFHLILRLSIVSLRLRNLEKYVYYEDVHYMQLYSKISLCNVNRKVNVATLQT